MNIETVNIEFPRSMKIKIDTYIKSSDINVEYILGRIINFKDTNISGIYPLTINNKTITVLYYGNYMQDKNKFFLENIKNPISWTSLKEYISELKVS